MIAVANSPQYRDLSPKQIVPRLADEGRYVASESTFYRVLREEDQMAHRSAAKPPTKRYRPAEKVAAGPNQVWSWDITYLRTPIAGVFIYLYMVMDVWSRKIVGAEVFTEESADNASRLIEAACQLEGIVPGSLWLHQDNGSPMKGAMFLETLRRLGVSASFSRPRVSDDNPYSESLYRTLKYCPAFPSLPFPTVTAAREWAAWFVSWYNTEHMHSGIQYVTPELRHRGEDVEILAKRHALYEQARERHPERWSGATRDWSPLEVVRLNPATTDQAKSA